MLTDLKQTICHLIKAGSYALAGLKTALREELAFRIEVIVSLIAIFLAIKLGHSDLEKIMLISSVLLVPIVELLNTAIELTLDRVSLELHPLVKKAKDISAAAIFLSIINALIVWGLFSLDSQLWIRKMHF